MPDLGQNMVTTTYPEAAASQVNEIDERHAAIAAAHMRKAALKGRLQTMSMQLAVLVAIVAVWFVCTQKQWVTPLLLPKIGAVLDALDHGLILGEWWWHIAITLQETAFGFLIGIALGMVVGALFAFVLPLRTAFYPYVVAMMSFPKIAIAPLLIVAFGYDMMPKVIIAAMLAFFPVMASASAGLVEVNADEVNLMKAIGASRWQELRYLRLPNAMSYVFPSLDVALVGALLGAVAAELIGAKGGLGYVLAQMQAYGDTAGMYGVLLLLAFMGSMIHVLIGTIRRLLPVSIMPRS